MNRKRILVATAATAVVLGAGGGAVWATTAASADVSGGERDRVGAAAVQAAGGGTVTDVEAGDDAGVAYEAEVRKADGTEVDVALDKDLKVIGQQHDTETDTPDRVLSATERTSAEQAAVAAVGAGATVLDVEAGDTGGPAYEAEVRDSAGAEWDVDLDAAFQVLAKNADD